MVPFFNAGAIAVLLTALFAFRFRAWNRPVFLTLYFLLFATAEGLLHVWWLPKDGLGPGMGVGAAGLAMVILALGWWMVRAERSAADPGGPR